MHRDLRRLADGVYDLVVVGGGIHGACVAWDAALRGLSVAVIDQGDFGHATSANSLKIIHGGFRYLRDLDMVRMRASIRERKILMRIAPHLVHPMPFLIPTYGWGVQNREVMRVGLKLYDVISCDRNRGVRDAQKRIPNGRIVSREECLRLAPGINQAGVTGGAVWYDGQVYNPDRLTLAFIRSAVDRGAAAANYLQVTGLVQEGQRVRGVQVRDVLTGQTAQLQAGLVVNTSGPWIDSVLRLTGGRGVRTGVPYAKAVNVVIKRPLTDGHAISVVLPKRARRNGQDPGGRRMYLTPWRGRTLVGSLHVASHGNPEVCRVTADEVSRLVDDLNLAYPRAAVRPDEVVFVHAGFLPITKGGPDGNPADLAGRSKIIDHQQQHGIDGLLSVVGIKYTTARDLAVKVVDRVLSRLHRRPTASRSAFTRLRGGDIEQFETLVNDVIRRRPCGLPPASLRQLIDTYGTDYQAVLRLAEQNPELCGSLGDDSPVVKAQVVYAVREEMACRVRDVVFRRTELGTAGFPGAGCLRACAEVMADALGWDAARVQQELDDVHGIFRQLGMGVNGGAGGRS